MLLTVFFALYLSFVKATIGVNVSVQLIFSLSGPHVKIRTNESRNFRKKILKDLNRAFENLTGFIAVKNMNLSLKTTTGKQRIRRQVNNRCCVLVKLVLIFQPYINTTDRNVTDITNDIYIIINGSQKIGIYIIIEHQTLQELLELVKSAVKVIEPQLCSRGYRFDRGSCYWYEPCIVNPCQHGGNCVVNIQRKPTCLCSEDDEYTYSGVHCENKTSKLFSDLKYIIAAAAGWFAAVVLIIAVICCMCRQKKRDKKAQCDNENIHEQETLSYNHPMGLLRRQRVPSNRYLTSRDDSYFIDYRRRHTYMEGTMDRNNLYNEATSDVEDDIESIPNFCNNAIFEKEFNIKRPQIRSESIPVFNNFRRPTEYRPDYI